MAIKSVSPEDAQAAVAAGALYIDVRSEREFEEGHPPGALNVPLLHYGADGSVTPNAEFTLVMQRVFARSAPLVLGCHSGNRSLQAARQLERAGFTELSEMSAGWDGARDAFGRLTPGWVRRGLPVETGAPPGSSYAEVRARTRR
ncbi:MAG: rhodanese-like domain-containing protein [Sorangiineae bacterium]|nr:rhodanese-like domain-containing protein [Polyangiaceae bacterium]MEB2321289.1 rhodanese-like domain-containing protein [Sorangiineae bacterium]